MIPSYDFNLDKLAYAVRMAETHDCSKGYGKSYNNCYGIRNGGTAPCEKVGINRMCIYDTPEESTEAFKIIWAKVYGLHFPTLADAKKWSGGGGANWLKNVKYYYNK